MAANLRHFTQNLRVIFHRSQQPLSRKLNIRLLSDNIVDRIGTEPPIPEYKAPQNEPTDRKRARLLYQSR